MIEFVSAGPFTDVEKKEVEAKIESIYDVKNIKFTLSNGKKVNVFCKMTAVVTTQDILAQAKQELSRLVDHFFAAEDAEESTNTAKEPPKPKTADEVRKLEDLRRAFGKFDN